MSKRQQEVRPAAGFTSELLRQVNDEKRGAREVLPGALSDDRLPAGAARGLSELYIAAGQPEQGARRVTRALAAPLPPADHAAALATAINVTLTEPKGDERNARLEKMIDELDTIPDGAVRPEVQRARRLLGYYRGDDIDAGIIKHATWIAARGEVLHARQRQDARRTHGVVAGRHGRSARRPGR